MHFEDRTNKIEKKGPISSFVSFVNLVTGHGPKITVPFVYLLDSVHSFYGMHYRVDGFLCTKEVTNRVNVSSGDHDEKGVSSFIRKNRGGVI